MADADTGQSLLEIVNPILAEERSIDLNANDVALIVLMRREIDLNPDGLLTLPYSTIQFLNGKIDLLDARDPQKAERRLTESISRLIRADCLLQADLLRLHAARDPEYQLTSLGEALAEWHLTQSHFSGEPLSAIFKAFIDQLARIVERAESAKTQDDWQIEIMPQMQHALRDMLINVQQHQRLLDRQHAEIRDFIPKLLTEQSEAAIRQCRDRLAEVLKTIHDLQETVLGSSSTITTLISRIYELGEPYELQRFEVVYDDLVRRINSINNWITQRLTDWTDHYGVVHNVLRTIVRVDRYKRISDALKRSIAEPPPWSLAVADEPPFYRMRTDLDARRRVRRAPRIKKAVHDRPPEFDEILPDELPDLLKRYARKDYEAFAEVRASRVIRKTVPELQPEGLKVISYVPDFFAWLVSIGVIDEDERGWEDVSAEITIEDLKVNTDDFS